ncbi:SDR family NAD(P)-dependent oxidoreductase [Taibaiella chishuiensis]|uniref:NAD(P)-dependent dehydrogenase (Short-subunit alcohol dehydrogenase family) n=1 Tax=Taibaiella chishuiensis TaxID=1434707 RepID=A0A2P8D7Q2_9BACT|nr:SDR family oxidoreductase [Taibaiella chishuiensis]PSK93244.1 NAD(P)-dependent dehydrogenase (short-subunit alcohol dehydrogenase family) [Taibaiella chishuiensis]
METTTAHIALVTGGSRGLGKDIALKLAAQGRDVILTYNSKAEEAQEVVAAIRAQGRSALALQLNTGRSDSFAAFVQHLQQVLEQDFGRKGIDFLVNNAGHGITVPSFADTTEAQFDELVQVHLKGVFFLTQQLLPLLNDGGAIVNISTGLTRFTHPGAGAYASVKAGVETLTRYMAKELGHRYIRANVVAPGAIATDFNGARLRDNAQVQDMIKSITALPRIGQADDVGGVVAFLCSDDAKWISGQRIEVAGGMYL